MKKQTKQLLYSTQLKKETKDMREQNTKAQVKQNYKTPIIR